MTPQHPSFQSPLSCQAASLRATVALATNQAQGLEPKTSSPSPSAKRSPCVGVLSLSFYRGDGRAEGFMEPNCGCQKGQDRAGAQRGGLSCPNPTPQKPTQLPREPGEDAGFQTRNSRS